MKFDLLIVESPRFLNLSNPIQIVAHYSTVHFICQIYGVPSPTVNWYKIRDKTKAIVEDKDLELLLVDSQMYVSVV